MSGQKITSEEDLKKYRELTAENLIKEVISNLIANQLHGKDWNFGRGVL